MLASGLKRLPTPQPSPLLVQRVRAQMEAAAVVRAEKKDSRTALALLVLFSWVITLASWPIVRLASQTVAGWLDVSARTAWVDLAGYVVLTWTTAGVAAAALAWQKQRERRLA